MRYYTKIKFRGLRCDNNQWVFGTPYFIDSEQVAYIIDSCATLNFTEQDSTFRGIPVIPETVGMWCGEFDSLKKEIYSGDILQNEMGDIAMVWLDGPAWHFGGLKMEWDKYLTQEDLSKWWVTGSMFKK